MRQNFLDILLNLYLNEPHLFNNSYMALIYLLIISVIYLSFNDKYILSFVLSTIL